MRHVDLPLHPQALGGLIGAIIQNLSKNQSFDKRLGLNRIRGYSVIDAAKPPFCFHRPADVESHVLRRNLDG